MVTDIREAKLPAWARKILADERHARIVAERKLSEHLDTVEETRISYGDYDNPIYVPEHFGLQTVRFQVGEKVVDSLYDSINVGLRADYSGILGVEVNGGRSIRLSPRASNVVRVELERG
jgi:hypothetical protein